MNRYAGINQLSQETTPEGKHFLFPVLNGRNNKTLKTVAIVFFVTGLVFGLFAIPMCKDLFSSTWGDFGFEWVFKAVFSLIVLIPAFISFSCICIGALIFFLEFRSELIIDEDEVHLIDHFPFYKHRRSIPKADLQAVDINYAGKTAVNGEVKSIQVSLGFNASSGDKNFIISYPRALLINAGNELSAELKIPFLAPSNEELLPIKEKESYDQYLVIPENSDILHQPLQGGDSFAVPAKGFLKGSKGLGIFSIIWLSFCTLVFGFMVSGIGEWEDGPPPVWVAIMFPVVFIGVGLGMAYAAIRMGTRKTLIALVNSQLKIKQTNKFGIKEDQFDMHDVENIKVGPSGMEVNDVPVNELQVHFNNEQKKKGFLSEREDEELYWIAANLRKHLQS